MPSCAWPTPACCRVMKKQAAQSDYRAICHRSFWPVTLHRAGESDPVAMGTTAADDKPHESKHIAFMSSQVLNGAGYGIVIRCGDNTFIGKINALAATTKIRETTLQVDVGRFVKFIAIVAVSMAVVLFSVGLGRGMSFVKAFVNGIIVVLVANIPQGLPATVTSALTLTAERMKSAHVLVKRTDIIESLGSATRIASDKTGTLTQNKMTVMNCWVNCQFRSAREIEATLHRALSPTKRSLSRRLSRASQSNLARSSINAVKKVLRRVSGSAAYRANNADMSEKASSVGGQGLPAVAELEKQQVPRPHLQRTSQYGDVLSRMSLGMNSVSAMVCSLRLRCNILYFEDGFSTCLVAPRQPIVDRLVASAAQQPLWHCTPPFVFFPCLEHYNMVAYYISSCKCGTLLALAYYSCAVTGLCTKWSRDLPCLADLVQVRLSMLGSVCQCI
jgi:hypothetical protein